MGFLEKIRQLFRSALRTQWRADDAQKQSLILDSNSLKRKVRIDLYLPKSSSEIWSLLLINDGQDAAALQLVKAHREINQHTNLLIAGIHAGDRMAEYGTAGIVSDKGLGKRSGAYQEFILFELLPYLHQRYPISANPERVGIAGFSLGGLSAMDLAWTRPKVFGLVGVFSGSLWWRNKAYDPKQPDANRVMHERVARENGREQRIWLMAGTADETSDRNNNGIIDAIDDTLQLKALLEKKIKQPEQNIRYVEVTNGQHNPETWASVIPDFLNWAFSNMGQKKEDQNI